MIPQGAIYQFPFSGVHLPLHTQSLKPGKVSQTPIQDPQNSNQVSKTPRALSGPESSPKSGLVDLKSGLSEQQANLSSVTAFKS